MKIKVAISRPDGELLDIFWVEDETQSDIELSKQVRETIEFIHEVEDAS